MIYDIPFAGRKKIFPDLATILDISAIFDFGKKKRIITKNSTYIKKSAKITR
jgi:hypothetical protein